MPRRFRYREAFTLACELTWYLFCFSLVILGLPALIVSRMSAFRNLEIFIAVLLTVFAVLPFSFQSLLRDQDSGFRLAIARSAQDAKGLTYLESLQVAFVSSAIYSGFIAVFQGLRQTDRLCLAGSNLIFFSLLVACSVAGDCFHCPTFSVSRIPFACAIGVSGMIQVGSAASLPSSAAHSAQLLTSHRRERSRF